MSGEAGAARPADSLRVTMRADLRDAMKARRPDAVAALRTTLAAIDNAEAVPVDPTSTTDETAHIAGARSGVGSTEALRRVLALDEVRAIVQAQVDERTEHADLYDEQGQVDAAARLRLEASALRGYLAD